MLFSEIYGSYFNVVSAILEEAVDGRLTEKRMTDKTTPAWAPVCSVFGDYFLNKPGVYHYLHMYDDLNRLFPDVLKMKPDSGHGIDRG